MSPYPDKWINWTDTNLAVFKRLPNYRSPKKWKKLSRTHFGEDCCLLSDTAHQSVPSPPNVFSYTLNSQTHFAPLYGVNVRLVLDSERLERQIAAVNRVDFKDRTLEENLRLLRQIDPAITASGCISPYPNSRVVQLPEIPEDGQKHPAMYRQKRLECCWDWSDNRVIIYDPDVPSSRVVIDRFPETTKWLGWARKRAEDAANIAAADAAVRASADPAAAAQEAQFDLLLENPFSRR